MEIHSPSQKNVLCEEHNCSGKENGVKNSQIYWIYRWQIFGVMVGFEHF